MHHGAVTAKSLPQNMNKLLRLSPKTIHHSLLLRLTPPSTRRSLRNSESKDSQLSNGSKTEKPLTIKVVELLMLLFHGFLRKLDQHPLNLPVMLLKRRLLQINSPLLSSALIPMMPSTLKLMSNFPIPKRKLDLFITLMPHAPLNLELNNHPLFSSDNLRRKLLFTLVLLIKIPFLLLSNHLWFQPFSNSLKMRLRLFLDNNKMYFSFSELSLIPNLLSKKLSKRQLMHTKEKFFLLTLVLLTKFKENSLNSWVLLRKISQPLELSFQLT